MEAGFEIRPHEEAAKLIEGKPAVTRRVFDGLLPELRGRAFTVTGVEAAHVLQRIRDEIAALPRGGEEGTWDQVKARLVEDLDPYLGDGAPQRAELLMRTHGFQAFQASNWRVAQEDEDTTHLQYLATEDDRVRDTHLALNGVVLPKDDTFWDKHYPPWEWGCRCRVRPMNPDLVDEERQNDAKRNPEDRLVMEGAVAEQLRNGTLVRGTRSYDVTAPSDGPDGQDAFVWHPDNMRLRVEELKSRYDPEVWTAFEVWARKTEAYRRMSVWDWLNQEGLPPIEKRRGAPVRQEPAKQVAPQPAAVKPALDKRIEDLEKRMVSAGFTPQIAAEVKALPAEVADLAGTVKMRLDATKTGSYSSWTKQITMQGDPTEWSGRPGLFYHEFGHHVHFERKVITDANISPKFKAAVAADVKRLKAMETEKPGIFSPVEADKVALEQYQIASYSGANLAEKSLISRFCDTLGGLSKGKWGWGHAKSYYKDGNNGAMEVFAHAFQAIATKDTVFMKFFPEVVAAAREALALAAP